MTPYERLKQYLETIPNQRRRAELLEDLDKVTFPKFKLTRTKVKDEKSAPWDEGRQSVKASILIGNKIYSSNVSIASYLVNDEKYRRHSDYMVKRDVVEALIEELSEDE